MKRLVMAFAVLAFAGMAVGDVPQGERRMMWMLVGWTSVENQWVGEGLAHDWDREIGDLRARGYKGFAVFAYTAYTIDVLRQLKKEGLL